MGTEVNTVSTSPGENSGGAGPADACLGACSLQLLKTQSVLCLWHSVMWPETPSKESLRSQLPIFPKKFSLQISGNGLYRNLSEETASRPIPPG